MFELGSETLQTIFLCFKMTSVALLLGMAVAGGSLGQAILGMFFANAISRQPGVSGEVKVLALVGWAFIESLVIYAMIFGFIMVYDMKGPAPFKKEVSVEQSTVTNQQEVKKGTQVINKEASKSQLFVFINLLKQNKIITFLFILFVALAVFSSLFMGLRYKRKLNIILQKTEKEAKEKKEDEFCETDENGKKVLSIKQGKLSKEAAN